jgi:hypothetical protein
MKITKETLTDLYQRVLQVAIDKYGNDSPDRILLHEDGTFGIENDIYAMGYFSHVDVEIVTAEDLETDSAELIAERLKRKEEERIAAEIRYQEERIKREEQAKQARLIEYNKLKKEFGN